jgi:hypothetical protein
VQRNSYYKLTENFDVCGGHKNFGVHNKLRSGAVIPYAKVYREVGAQNKGPAFADGFTNNTCIQSAANLAAYSFTYCDTSAPDNATNLGLLGGNKIYNPDEKMTVPCGSSGLAGPERKSKALTELEFQASGADASTSVHVTPLD